MLALRVKELKKTGPRPEKAKDQVAWLTDLIGKLQRVLELGDQDDDLARVAFSGEIFITIFNLFPNKDRLKMAKYSEVYGKYSKERMEDILRRLEEQRDDANLLDKI